MIVALGCDHAGFPLKITISTAIQEAGCEMIDVGTDSQLIVDYPDYSVRVGKAILTGEADRGIMICGSGVGACIAANKMKGIYASVCHDTYSAHQGVEHDQMNYLTIGARIVGQELAKEIVKAFLAARFEGDQPGGARHLQRTHKIKAIESGSY